MAKDSERYTEEEAARRRDELAKRMLSMPPQPLVKTKPKEDESKKRDRPPKKKP